MDSLRGDTPVKFNSKDDIIFQCLEWIGTNESKIEYDISTKKNKKILKHVVKLYGVTKEGYSVSVNNNEFKPYFFVKVSEHFTDLHKVKLFNSIVNKLKENAKKLRQYNSYAADIISLEFVKRKEFYGFTNNKLFKFIKITFQNSIVMNKVTNIVKEGIVIPSINKSKIKFKIYESNITPFIRFIHTKDVNAAGWVKIPGGKYTVNRNNDKTSTCQIDVDIHYDSIEFVENNNISPMLIASFDIECSSSHGDFPLPKKNYKKLGFELYDKIHNLKDANKESIIKFIKLAFTTSPKLNIDDISYVFTKDEEQPTEKEKIKMGHKIYAIMNTDENYKILAKDLLKYFFQREKNDIHSFQKDYHKHIISIINDAFSNTGAKNNKHINTIYTKTDKKPPKRIIEEVSKKALKQIYLLFKKIKKLFPIDEYDINNDTINDFIDIYIENYNESNEHKIITINKEFEFDEDDVYTKNIVNNIGMCINMLYSYFDELFPEIDGSRDTYCKRIVTQLDNEFPSVEGDKVIQIGTTIQKYGEPECYLKHIISLKSCSPIDGAVVEWYNTEQEVLLAWTKFIQKLDPDIVTGYNIFGFDYSFMWDRAEELNDDYPDENILEQFRKLGRIKYTNRDNENIIKNSRLEIKKLASSALGDNTLKYITMEGRIMLDLFKVVQKDFNLVSYKLDYVAETFINDKITKIDKNTLTIKGIQTLNVGHFITINYSNDKKYKEKKFKIIGLDDKNNTIKLNEDIESSILDMKPKWTLAKDDVSPQDIFRLQEGSADDRCIVATYCIQDCALCNNLIDKLKIITNNIGMANVCSVPLSYLFLRGQGVKIFSLVSQQCRKEGFLIPLIKYKKDEILDTHAKTDHQENMFEYGDDDQIDVPEGDGGYEGAIVLKPKPGIYLDTPVVVLDYASLYPSSMISENLSHDSIILEDNRESAKYLGEKGIEELKKIGYGYEDIQHDVYKWIDPNIKSKGKQKCGVKVCRFAQPLDGSKCVIPNKLRELLKARKNTRKLIKFKTLQFINSKDTDKSGMLEEQDDNYVLVQVNGDKETFNKKSVKNIKDTYTEFEKSVFDGLQLAFKMTANSLYGQLGASTSPIFLKDIAASTTATGRKLLYLAKDKVEEHFDGAEIVYGDSVTSDTPILLKNINTGNIIIKQIDDINDLDWGEYNNFKPFTDDLYDKQKSFNSNYLIQTSNGWKPLLKIIRHKTNKKIYRITTHTSIVDVTEDHSLLDMNKKQIKPVDLKVGDKLLHNYIEFDMNNEMKSKITLKDINEYNISCQSLENKKAYIYGFFYGDGSCGVYKPKNNIKYSWALNNKDLDLCLILQSLLLEIYKDEFKILDTLNSSGVYKIVPIGTIKKYVNEYRDLFYNKDKYKIIPDNIMNGSYEIRKAFLCGYYAADGYKCINSKSKNIILTNKGKIGSSMLYYLVRSLGFNASINTRRDKRDIIKITCSFNKLRKNENEIKKIEYLRNTNYEEYVYDIETSEGDFNTGFPLIVKNTDSVFINFNPKDENGKMLKNKAGLIKSIEMGVQAEKYIKPFLKPPHNLEYEKTFWPFILFSKKRYIGNKYEFKTGENDYKQTSMGIVLKRRDNAEIVKHVYGGVIDILMNQKNLQLSIEFLRTELFKLLNGKFGMEMLIVTKSLRGYYKNPESIAHKVLADRMGVRDPGNKPSSNDRIPYAYIEVKENKFKSVLQGDRIEHPDYIKEMGLKPDYKFYITNQIMKPVGQIYSLIVEKLDGFKYPENYYESKYKSLLNTLTPEKARNKITALKFKDACDIVFGDVIRVAENRKSKAREITDFFKQTF